MVEPPSLPYARDEASTSHHTFTYPSYTDTFETEEEEADNEGSVEDEANAAPQYWAAKRHRSGKGKAKSEEEHSAYDPTGRWRWSTRMKD
jgi:regulator-associated protein of mTOR